MGYVYLMTKPHGAFNEEQAIYSVGFYDPAANFIKESEFYSRTAAARRVNYLNGGIDKLEIDLDQYQNQCKTIDGIDLNPNKSHKAT